MSSGRSRSGGTSNWDHVEPEEQILAKGPSVDGSRQDPVRRRHDPHVHPIGLPPPTRSISFASIARSSFACASAPRSPDLVEQQRAGVRELEPPDAPVRRAGERAALVAEHLALHEIARDRGAVDAHERPVAPRARRGGSPRRRAPCPFPTRRSSARARRVGATRAIMLAHAAPSPGSRRSSRRSTRDRLAQRSRLAPRAVAARAPMPARAARPRGSAAFRGS